MGSTPLGLGVDTVWISTFRPLLSAEFKRRAFTPDEIESRQGPHLEVRLAGCFAAKEAILKALGTGWSNGIAWTDVEILHEPSGLPMVSLSGEAQEAAAERGITRWLLSLSHDGDYATATALALGSVQAASSGSGNGE